MNVNEYGNVIRVNVKEDISVNTNTLQLISPSPINKKKFITAADGLVVGGSNVITPLGTFLANEYVEYTIKAGDITTAGEWVARVASVSFDTTINKISDVTAVFTVLE